MRKIYETDIDVDDFKQAKDELFGLIACSGVEYLEADYTQAFTLTRQQPATGPFERLQASVTVKYIEDEPNKYESVLVDVAHRGIEDEELRLLSGTRFCMTSVEGTPRYAWTNSMFPFPRQPIPEAQPPHHLPNDVREDFNVWQHELSRKQSMTRPMLELALREIQGIAELD